MEWNNQKRLRVMIRLVLKMKIRRVKNLKKKSQTLWKKIKKTIRRNL